MTITMTEKNQVTIPKKIADILHLRKGSLFHVEVRGHRIEFIPLEVREKSLSKEEYEKLDQLMTSEKGREKRLSSGNIRRLKQGHI